jgi:hypothetical protein
MAQDLHRLEPFLFSSTKRDALSGEGEKMKRILSALLFIASVAVAQTSIGSSLAFDWAKVAATGQLGSYLVFNNQSVARPGNYTIDWSLSGTAPSACTFRVEGSSDGVNWYGLDATSPATTSCTASNMESIAYKPVRYLRINVVAYTAGDGTTAITFHYTGGRS